MRERRLQSVPYRILYSGMIIPGMSLGTYDLGDSSKQSDVVYDAINRGFRMIDCASAYSNEEIVGNALHRTLQEGKVKRDDLFISSKLRSDQHKDVQSACLESLNKLQLDYLDLYIIHWPFRIEIVTDESGETDKRIEPFSPVEFLNTWKQCERLVEKGLVKYIGMSNMTIAKLESVLPFCKIPPAVLEMELHPCFQQQELFSYAKEHKMIPIGLCPVGSALWSDKDSTAFDNNDMENEIIKEIALDHAMDPSMVCIKWAVQRGQIPVISAVNAVQWIENVEQCLLEPLTKEEMEKIKFLDQKVRVIKGEKLLFDGAKDWTDLWDVEGTITK